MSAPARTVPKPARDTAGARHDGTAGRRREKHFFDIPASVCVNACFDTPRTCAATPVSGR